MGKLFDKSRIKHLCYGYLIGLGANDWYCAEYTGFGVAAALELKDYLWGGKPDWIDFTFTVVGVNLGYLTRFLVLWMRTSI